MNVPVRLRATLLTVLVTAAAGSFVVLDIGALTGDRAADSSPQTSRPHPGPTPPAADLPQSPRDTASIPLPEPFPVPGTVPDTETPAEQEKTGPTGSPKEREQRTGGTGLRGASTS
ncbi:hypothetical protein [Rhodococcus aetherivorans]